MDQNGERVFTGEVLVFETLGSVEGAALTSTVQNRVDIFSPRPIQTGAWGGELFFDFIVDAPQGALDASGNAESVSVFLGDYDSLQSLLPEYFDAVLTNTSTGDSISWQSVSGLSAMAGDVLRLALLAPPPGTTAYEILRDVDVCNDQNLAQPTVKRCRLSLHYTVDGVSQANSNLKKNILVNLPPEQRWQRGRSVFYPESATVGESVEVRGRVSPPGQLGDLVCVIPTRYDVQGLPITATPLITRPNYSTGEYSVTFTPTRAADWEVLTRWVYDFDGNPTASDCLDPSFVLADSSAQPPLSPPTVPVSEGKSTLQLSSTGDLGASVGDWVTITLQLSPNPGITSGTIEVVDADGAYLQNGKFTTSSAGAYQTTLQLQNEGIVAVSADWSGSTDYASSEAELDIVVNGPTGVGIVVIAADPSDLNFSEIEDLADEAYDVMLTNGVPSANIRYLHSDFGVTSNWRATHDATSANLSASIDTWAVAQVNTSSTALAEQSPLYVFIIGGGGTDYVWIDSSSLSASALDLDLDEFNTKVNALVGNGASASSALPVYVMIDSDMSGTFMDDLGVVDGRVILSSTGDTALTGDNLRTGSLYDSYSYMLFSSIELGGFLRAQRILTLSQQYFQRPPINIRW